MTDTWKPEAYKDQFTEAIMKRIEAKAKKKGKNIDEDEPDTETSKSSGKVVDIMDLLKRSVEANSKKSDDKQEPKKKKAVAK